MEITWILFVPALLLLFYPLDDLLRGQVRLRDYEGIRNDCYGSGDAWWRQPWVWVDPLRAFAGGWLLRHAWIVDPLMPEFWHDLPLSGMLVILSVALGVQMHTRRDPDVLFAPLGYSAGIILVLLSPQIALLVIVLAGACLMAFRSWSAYFLCGALGAGAFGYLLLHELNFSIIAVFILLIEPLLISLLAGRELMLPLARPVARIHLDGFRETRQETVRVSAR